MIGYQPDLTLPRGHTATLDDAHWLALPYLSLTDLPSPNRRDHWAVKGRQTRELRDTTLLLARKARLPAGSHCTVELNYIPPDARRRDADNLVLILKACCDALVDHGVVPDDTPGWMSKLMPIIHPAQKLKADQARLLLRVQITPAAPVTHLPVTPLPSVL